MKCDICLHRYSALELSEVAGELHCHSCIRSYLQASLDMVQAAFLLTENGHSETVWKPIMLSSDKKEQVSV